MTLAEKIPLAHAWYCLAMGGERGPIKLPLNMTLERAWYDWLSAGFTGKELRKVMRYLRREIAAQKRNPGALKLTNLLNVEAFANDLALASSDMDPDRILPKAPEL